MVIFRRFTLVEPLVKKRRDGLRQIRQGLICLCCDANMQVHERHWCKTFKLYHGNRLLERFDTWTEKRENALDSVLQYRDSAKEFDYIRAFGRIERQEIIATCKTA